LLQAMQRLEAQQVPLDDAQAMREAHSQQRGMAQRLLVRAGWLAMAALIGLLSFGLMHAVVGGARQINAVASLAGGAGAAAAEPRALAADAGWRRR
jgi:hypothetical protein